MATQTTGASKKKPLRRLTQKQVKLVKGIVAGKTTMQAAVDAGYGSNPNSANSIAHETLQNPTIQEQLQRALIRHGITVDAAVEPVAQALHSNDLDYRLKGHDRAAKLLRLNQAEGTVSVNFLKVNNGESGEFFDAEATPDATD